MVILEDGRDLLFAGNKKKKKFFFFFFFLTRALCDLLAGALGIPAERVYIEFSAPPAHLFGWNGGTFKGCG